MLRTFTILRWKFNTPYIHVSSLIKITYRLQLYKKLSLNKLYFNRFLYFMYFNLIEHLVPLLTCKEKQRILNSCVF